MWHRSILLYKQQQYNVTQKHPPTEQTTHCALLQSSDDHHKLLGRLWTSFPPWGSRLRIRSSFQNVIIINLCLALSLLFLMTISYPTPGCTLVNCPTRLSLYYPLGSCIHHLYFTTQISNEIYCSNVLGCTCNWKGKHCYVRFSFDTKYLFEVCKHAAVPVWNKPLLHIILMVKYSEQFCYFV